MLKHQFYLWECLFQQIYINFFTLWSLKKREKYLKILLGLTRKLNTGIFHIEFYLDETLKYNH